MRDIVADPKVVAFCGLYCGACRAYVKEKCPGCQLNHKATWCKVRTCCLENDLTSCADCKEHGDPRSCRKFHNLFSRAIGFLLRSDRPACIAQIKDIGIDGHAQRMAELRRVSLRR